MPGWVADCGLNLLAGVKTVDVDWFGTSHGHGPMMSDEARLNWIQCKPMGQHRGVTHVPLILHHFRNANGRIIVTSGSHTAAR